MKYKEIWVCYIDALKEIMPPKWAKTSKPEDEQKCGLYAEILYKVHINP